MAQIFDDVKKIIIRKSKGEDQNDIYEGYVLRQNSAPVKISFQDLNEAQEYLMGTLASAGYNTDDIERASDDGFVVAYDTDESPEYDDVVAQEISDAAREFDPEAPVYTPGSGENTAEEEQTAEPPAEITHSAVLTPNGEGTLRRPTVLKRVIKIGAVVGAITVVGVGVSHIINHAVANKSKLDLDLDKSGLDDLYGNSKTGDASISEILKNLKDGSLAKTEYTKVLNFCETFNSRAAQANNFRMESDGNNYLEISAEEALYTSIVLNGYNADQITEILGSKTVSYDEIMKSYQSVCDKIKVYSMNATTSSGLETLINDGQAQSFYHAMEGQVIEFNQSANKEADENNSNDVLYTAKANFIGLNAADNFKPGVAHITSVVFSGFADANVNNAEDLSYNGKIEEGSQISEGETASDIISKINNKGYLDKAKSVVQTSVDSHNAKVTATLSESKQALVEALKSNGATELANKVANRTDISDLEDEIGKQGGDISDLFDKYQSKIDDLNPSGISADKIISAIDQKTTQGKIGNLEILRSNRIRNKREKEIEDTQENNNSNDNSSSTNNGSTSTSDSGDYSSDSSGSSSSNEGTESETEEEEEEKEIPDNEEFIDQSDEGMEDANTWVNTPGAYKYDDEIKNEYMDEGYTAEEIANMTPSQLWKEMTMAGISLPDATTDEQLQEALKNASQEKGESYKEGWLLQIQTSIANSYSDGQAELDTLKGKYTEAVGSSETTESDEHSTQVQGENLTDEEKTAVAEVVDADEEEEIEVLDEEEEQEKEVVDEGTYIVEYSYGDNETETSKSETEQSTAEDGATATVVEEETTTTYGATSDEAQPEAEQSTAEDGATATVVEEETTTTYGATSDEAQTQTEQSTAEGEATATVVEEETATTYGATSDEAQTPSQNTSTEDSAYYDDDAIVDAAADELVAANTNYYSTPSTNTNTYVKTI